MSSDRNKVHKLQMVNDNCAAADVAEEPQSPTDAAMAATSRDMSKVAVIVSLLVVVLLVIFFFGMNRNIAGLTEEVKSLSLLRQDISVLDQRMGQMEEGMPLQMKRLIAHGIVNEMAMKAAYLGNSMDDEKMRNKMQDVLQALKEVRQDLEQ